jgi:hypothetical protein
MFPIQQKIHRQNADPLEIGLKRRKKRLWKESKLEISKKTTRGKSLLFIHLPWGPFSLG